jgi:hypothetical protein
MNTAVKATLATMNAGKMFFCNINIEGKGNMPTSAVFNHITSVRVVADVMALCYKFSLLLIMFIIAEH